MLSFGLLSRFPKFAGPYLHQENCSNPDFCELRCVTCAKLIKPDGFTSINNDDVCSCKEPVDHHIEVSKGILNVSTPFLDGLFHDQFGHLNDFMQNEGIMYWMYVCGGHFLLPKSESTDWPGRYLLFYIGVHRNDRMNIIASFI